MKYKQKHKNYLILRLFLFGISLFLGNCTLEDNLVEQEKIDLSNVKTVSFKDAIEFFKSKKEKIRQKNAHARSTENSLEVTPDWNTLAYNDIAYTNAQLTTANSEINRNGEYSSELYFINVNNHIRNVIFTLWKDEVDSDGNVINGRIFFNDLEGKFIDGYIIEDGIFTKRYRVQAQTQQASFLPLFFFQSVTTVEDCWNTDTLGEFDGGILEEVVITASGGEGTGSGGSNGSGYSGSYNWYYTSGSGSTGYGGYVNGATSWNGIPTGGGGGSSLSSGQITSAAAAILMVSPVDPDENGECPEGYVLNTTTGQCDPICNTGGKVYNSSTETCECPEGTVEDREGNCVAKPCEGNPVRNPEIAPQYGPSGTKGALHGCTRYGSDCSGLPGGRTKPHAGIDLKNEQGAPIYAMYDGYIYSTKYDEEGAGYNTRVHSTVNGKNILISYFHLQETNRVLQTNNPLTYVKAGDIIGYQGDSGNLKDAMNNDDVDSHVHIEVREHDGSTSWGYSHYKLVDPRDYLSTTIDDNGVSQVNTNCN